MKHLKTYREIFESTTSLTKQQIDWLNKCTKGTWALNSETGLVDVEGDFDCGSMRLKGFKGVRFGKVGGGFSCHYNSLTSLEGAPQEVGGGFTCHYNSLTTLEGSPQEIGGGFSCHYNSLTTLEGAPQEVGGHFLCYGNSLTTLEGAPQEIGGDFSCNYNSLTSLEGAPKKVGGYFDCGTNSLTSLQGAPQEVGEGFFCSKNSVSETTLKKIWNEMKSGFTYNESLKRLASDIPKKDWDLLDKSGVELDDKFLKGNSVLRRFL